MNSVPSIPGVEVGAPWLDGCEAAVRHGYPVARIVQMIDASIQGMPVGWPLADALDGPGTPGSHSTRTVASTL